MRCLIIKNDGIGDLVLASGIISDLAKRFKRLDLVTCIQNQEIAEMISGVGETIFVSRDEIRYSSFGRKIGLNVLRCTSMDRRALHHLQNNNYDVAICLRRYIRQSSLIIMRHVRATKKYCAWQYPTNCSFEQSIKLSAGWERLESDHRIIPELQYYRSFLAKAGFPSQSGPQLQLPNSISNSSYNGRIGFVLGGNSTNWNSVCWNELIRKFLLEGRSVTLFGGADAEAIIAKDIIAHSNTSNLIGRVSIKQSVNHLRGIDLIIGNDTGFTHFAALVSSRVMVILGGGTFRRFFPWPNSNNQYVIFYGLECFDCNWKCKYTSRVCHDKITVADVKKYSDDILEGTASQVLNLNSKQVNVKIGWASGGGNYPSYCIE